MKSTLNCRQNDVDLFVFPFSNYFINECVGGRISKEKTPTCDYVMEICNFMIRQNRILNSNPLYVQGNIITFHVPDTNLNPMKIKSISAYEIIYSQTNEVGIEQKNKLMQISTLYQQKFYYIYVKKYSKQFQFKNVHKSTTIMTSSMLLACESL